jgi:hypothetical protein
MACGISDAPHRTWGRVSLEATQMQQPPTSSVPPAATRAPFPATPPARRNRRRLWWHSSSATTMTDVTRYQLGYALMTILAIAAAIVSVHLGYHL